MIPVLDARTSTVEALMSAFADHGAVQLHHPLLPLGRAQQMLAAARAFFARSNAEKSKLAVEHSPHFRGYSRLDNERDWREQLHFGSERAAIGCEPAYLQLEGPNLWPADPAWRLQIAEYFSDVTAIGAQLSAWIAVGLGLPTGDSSEWIRDPYVLMKLIRYEPQHFAAAYRPGVAAHVDFSWLTLTLQDDAGGFEIQRPDGSWAPVSHVPGALLVHLGELLQFATRGRLRATPHRVLNGSAERERVSIPLFLNPNLRARVPRFDLPGATPCAVPAEAMHVHRFLPLDDPRESFQFGEQEWLRKGLKRWCVHCAGPGA